MNMHDAIIASNLSTLGDEIATEISITAARLVVEEGLDFGAAKLRAVKQLGLPARTQLPSHDEVEAEVRDYIALFCADTQPAELQALRELACLWMQRMAEFRPYLGGSVWHGTATKLSDIYIALFCDDSKSAEIALIDHRADYMARTIKGFDGATVEALSIHAPCKALNTEIGVHLMVYDYDDLRGALKLDSQGRKPRGDMAAVAKLLEQN
jgi:hypothetical protein